jgi:hypothetical protein
MPIDSLTTNKRMEKVIQSFFPETINMINSKTKYSFSITTYNLYNDTECCQAILMLSKKISVILRHLLPEVYKFRMIFSDRLLDYLYTVRHHSSGNYISYNIMIILRVDIYQF